MLVDDDLVSTLISRKIVLSSGVFNNNELIIHTYNFPEKAIEHLEKYSETYKSIDLIMLLDINMPKVDGFQFLEICNERFKEIRLHVFMLTSSISPEHRKKANSYSLVKNFFVKPLTYENIKEIKGYINELKS